MNGVRWETVQKYLPKPWKLNDNELLDEIPDGKLIELRIVLLNKEKNCYWELLVMVF